MSKLIAILALTFAGCGAGTPQTRREENRLQEQVTATLDQMEARDPAVADLLNRSYAYAVFPDVAKGGVVYIGGAYGNGIIYEQGKPSGLVELKQGSVGLEVGAQTYAELIVLRTPEDAERLKLGNFDVGADANVVVLTSGAAAAADFRNGVAVLVMPRGGLMAGITVTGQTITYHPWISRQTGV